MRVAIGQVDIAFHDNAANLTTLTSVTRMAGEQQADVLVLPECPLVGWLSPGAHGAAEPVPGAFTASLADLAAQYDMAVVTGVEERVADRTHNAAVLIGPDGEMLLHHRKIDELEIGRATDATGDRLGVTRLDGATVALDICADSWGNHIVGVLALMGAQVLFTPCAWAIEPGREQANTEWIIHRYRTLAQRHGMTFVAANSVGRVDCGPWEGRVLHGDSLVVGPDGVLAHGARNQSDLIVVDVG